MWMTSGQAVTFPIDFMVDGEFVVPTSATATVFFDDTTAVMTDVVLDVSTTSTSLVVSASNNLVGAEQIYATRYVVVTFIHDGRQYVQRSFYRLIRFLPLTVTEQDVRSELGLTQLELPDRDIDLVSAYLLLRSDYGDTFVDALNGGSYKTLSANRAIKFKAALELLDSLQLRVAITFKAEDSQMSRMSTFDIGRMRLALGQKLSSEIGIITGTVVSGSPILILSAPTDAITGVDA